jgi:GAF domain-containing protein
VPDVAAQDNYIACSFTVKSEIVVPLFVDGKT